MIPAPLGPPSCSICKPRASGDDPRPLSLHDVERIVNPARAGMIRRGPAGPSRRRRKPRASGDDPSVDDSVITVL